MLKTKFEFNYLQNALYIHQPGSPRQSITKTFTTNWGSPGFILEPANHWITFTVYPNKIRAFYKQVETDDSGQAWPSEVDLTWNEPKDWKVSADTLAPLNQIITYYQKDLDLESSLPKTNPLIFNFTQADQIQKINGVWVKKH